MLIPKVARMRRNLCVLVLLLPGFAMPQEVVILPGLNGAIEWLQQEDWWGEARRGEQMAVPRALITGINPAWRETAKALPVGKKKEVFYRLMLPLVVHANELVIKRRDWLNERREQLVKGSGLTPAQLEALRDAAILLRIRSAETAQSLGASNEELIEVIDQALYRLDVIPPGLVLGQAAYESGYGTSRFAVEGNALFGQWTYGGQGLVPGQQRSELGDHRIAAFDWPFDSVRGYYLNLSSHPAYEDFRRLRAELKAAGKPVTSLALADGLVRYSERGREYVDTLKGMIRVNRLDLADDAKFRDQPRRFIVGARNAQAAQALDKELQAMRAAGEVERIVERMRLD
ncbi:MAG: glucosaminidase domain-containing protein [Wenzhouxiangellaceae bacterium]|nr:glucosaminidase domain-containing protein [Wenzhouxiangellaceae bacterium]